MIYALYECPSFRELFRPKTQTHCFIYKMKKNAIHLVTEIYGSTIYLRDMFYPFIAPIMIPFTNCFWSNGYTKSTGSVVTIAIVVLTAIGVTL